MAERAEPIQLHMDVELLARVVAIKVELGKRSGFEPSRAQVLRALLRHGCDVMERSLCVEAPVMIVRLAEKIENIEFSCSIGSDGVVYDAQSGVADLAGHDHGVK